MSLGRTRSSVSNKIEEIKDAHNEKKETKAREIHEKRAANELLFVKKLKGINWIKSKMPEESLHKMSKPELNMTDWQLRILKLCQLINSSSVFIVDTEDLDKVLIDIAMKLAEACEQGYETTASRAVKGLVKLLEEVRDKIPTTKEDDAVRFTKQGVVYASDWLKYLGMCCEYDQRRKQVKELKVNAEKYKEEEKKAFEEFKERLQEPEFVLAVKTILKTNKAVTPQEREALKMLQIKAINNVLVKMATSIYEQNDLACEIKGKRAEIIYNTLLDAPLAIDQYNAEYFKEALKKQNAKFAAIDEFFARNDEEITELNGELDKIDSNKGNEALRAKAAETAGEMLTKYFEEKNKDSARIKSESQKAMREMEELYKPETVEQDNMLEQESLEPILDQDEPEPILN